MGRLWFGGGDWRDFTAEGFAVLSGATFDTTVKRTGGASLKNTSSGFARWDGGILTGTIYSRVYVMVTTLPTSGTATLMTWGGNAGAGIGLTSGGVFTLGSGNGTTPWTPLAGGTTFPCVLGRWYCLELKMTCTGSGSVTQLEYRVDGVLIQTSGVLALTADGSLPQLFIGEQWANAASQVCNYDDWAVNDTVAGTGQTAYPGPGAVAYLFPAADSSVTGYTNGAGTGTNLWDALNNTPPVGVATGSSTATSQIKDVVANTTDNYVATLQTYASQGVAGNIAVVQHIAMIGQASIAASSAGITLTNPTVAENTGSGPSAVAGTYPSNWVRLKGTMTHAPAAPAQGTAPTLKIRKNTATAIAQMCCGMCLLVDFVPKPPGFRTIRRPVASHHRHARGRF